jgi:hypothetical protein
MPSTRPTSRSTGAGLQLAEGDDGGDPVVAVLVAHVADHAVALVLAEVDVEVGHRHALGIEEALEQQAPAQRIEIGDLERPRDQRARSRTAARPDRHAVVLRPLDEVGDDQEVAGEAHLLDHVELVGEALLVLRELDVGSQPADVAQLLQARAGHLAQGLAFRSARQLGVAWQDRLARLGHVGAALGDCQGVVAGFRQVGEHFAHLLRRLEIVLGRKPAAVRVLDVRALLDAEQHVVRRVHRRFGIVHVVGADDRQALVIGKVISGSSMRRSLSSPWRCSSR